MARSKSSKRSAQSRNNKSTDETEIIDVDANDKLASWQSQVNQHLYDTIAATFGHVRNEFEPNDSVAIIVAAVSTNLGMILAQIPESARASYISAASNIVHQSLINTLETIAEQRHGQVGHA